MLTCALIVWLLNPYEWNRQDIRSSHLTNLECKKNLILNKNYCIEIDKRRSFTKKEWLKDNCSLSEHKWVGDKIDLEKF